MSQIQHDHQDLKYLQNILKLVLTKKNKLYNSLKIVNELKFYRALRKQVSQKDSKIFSYVNDEKFKQCADNVWKQIIFAKENNEYPTQINTNLNPDPFNRFDPNLPPQLHSMAQQSNLIVSHHILHNRQSNDQHDKVSRTDLRKNEKSRKRLNEGIKSETFHIVEMKNKISEQSKNIDESAQSIKQKHNEILSERKITVQNQNDVKFQQKNQSKKLENQIFERIIENATLNTSSLLKQCNHKNDSAQIGEMKNQTEMQENNDNSNLQSNNNLIEYEIFSKTVDVKQQNANDPSEKDQSENKVQSFVLVQPLAAQQAQYEAQTESHIELQIGQMVDNHSFQELVDQLPASKMVEASLNKSLTARQIEQGIIGPRIIPQVIIVRPILSANPYNQEYNYQGHDKKQIGRTILKNLNSELLNFQDKYINKQKQLSKNQPQIYKFFSPVKQQNAPKITPEQILSKMIQIGQMRFDMQIDKGGHLRALSFEFITYGDYKDEQKLKRTKQIIVNSSDLEEVTTLTLAKRKIKYQIILKSVNLIK